MTTVDSKTIVSLDATDLVFGVTENKDNVQVEALQVTSEELKCLRDESDFNPLTYIPKGYRSYPSIRGSTTQSQAPRNNSSTPSTSRNDSPTKGSSRTNGSSKPISTPGTSSKDKDKAKRRN